MGRFLLPLVSWVDHHCGQLGFGEGWHPALIQITITASFSRWRANTVVIAKRFLVGVRTWALPR